MRSLENPVSAMRSKIAPNLPTFEQKSRLPLGASRVHERGLEFLVWAPQVEQLEVHLLDGDEGYVPLSRQDHGYYHGVVEADRPDCRYFYRLNGRVERPDPASRLQPEGVHGPSRLVDRDFPWTDNGWVGLEQESYIFYELHVGTYTSEGTFAALMPHLRSLKSLGIAALELMPVAEFPGNRNWGYDGVYPFAVHHGYGGPNGLKQLVDACHGLGLAVVLDVVYNHLGPEGNYLAEFGPYFTDRYQTPWGAALNFDGAHSDPVVRYFVENALQWVDEFHIDALRLDAIHGIVDRNAQPFLACLADSVEAVARNRNRRIHLIAECDLNDARFLRPTKASGYGLHAQWNDDFHHALHSLQTGEENGYYADFGRVEHLAKSMRDGFVYEGQYSKYRKRRQGNSARDLNAAQFVVCSQNHDQVGNRMFGERSSKLLDFEGRKLSAAAVVLSPFLPLLFMGEEFSETAPFLYFTSHSDRGLAEAVRRGRRHEFASFAWQGEPPDPQAESSFRASKVNHHIVNTEPHRTMREFYRELIRLRKMVPALRELNKENVEAVPFADRKALCVRRWCDRGEVFMLLNFGANHAEVPVKAPAGDWCRLLDSADSAWLGPGSPLPQSIGPRLPETLTLAPKSACLFSRVPS